MNFYWRSAISSPVSTTVDRFGGRLAAAVGTLALSAGVAVAQPAAAPATQFPNKPIRFLVGVAPGGGTDFVARLLGQKLTEKWGQPVVTENRTGATGLIAMELAAKAAPDGYTYIVFNIAHLMAAALARKATVDTAKDFTPVAMIAIGTLMLAVHPSAPAKNLADFIAYAKSRPGKLNYASGGQASIQHVSMELLKRETGIDLVHVPYKGTGPGMVDLLAGQVQASLTNMLAVYPHVKAGKLSGLAVSGAKRNALAPEVPTFAELGYPAVDANLWQGIMAPARTPPATVIKLSRAVAEVMHTPDAIEKLASQGAEPAGTTPGEFAAFLQNERSKWLQLAREIKISVD